MTCWDLFVSNQLKFLNGEYYVEVKDHHFKIHPTENIFFYGNEINQSLCELNIKFKMKLRLGEIRNLSTTILMK